MPAPVVVCLLVAAVLVGLACPLAGAGIAGLCAAIEFFLPSLAA